MKAITFFWALITAHALSGQCIEVNFDQFQTGEKVTEASGIHITAESGTNTAIIFNTLSVSGEDYDLCAPNETFGGNGIGSGGETTSEYPNSEIIGNILIIAEDTADANGDGLIDDPDDDQFGGKITFQFETASYINVLKFIDIEEVGSKIEFYVDNLLTHTTEIPQTGCNGVVEIEVSQTATSMEITLESSGGISSLEYCPSTQLNVEITNFNGHQTTEDKHALFFEGDYDHVIIEHAFPENRKFMQVGTTTGNTFEYAPIKGYNYYRIRAIRNEEFTLSRSIAIYSGTQANTWREYNILGQQDGNGKIRILTDGKRPARLIYHL